MLKYFLLLLLTWGSALSLQAQSFPESWRGLWKGALEVWSAGQKTREIPMSLEIWPADTAWTFIITYLADPAKPDVRPYSLIAVDEKKGHYAIDEHNDILLDAYLLGNCLYDRFSLMNTDLFSRICLEDGVLEYEIVSGRSEPVRISGGTVVGTDTIPAVNSYGLSNLTRAILRRE